MAGWEAPPLTAVDGAAVVSQLALHATKEHHGNFVRENQIFDLTED